MVAIRNPRPELKKVAIKTKKMLKTVFIGNTRPRQMFNLYFYFLFFATILLMTPLATAKGQWNFLEALFTASSAFSDTGLTVKSTANDFTFFGQLIILLLIKFGGIGLIAVKLFLLALFSFGGHYSNLKDRLLLQSERGSTKIGNTLSILKIGIIVMLVSEFFGAVLLAFYFYFVPIANIEYGLMNNQTYYHNFWLSLWSGIFHSVSATNNAGFDIVGSNSLMPFRSYYFVQSVFIIQFIIGGIGFPIFYDLVTYFRLRKHKRFRFSLFTKITTLTYFLVALIGVSIIMIIERTAFIYNKESLWSKMPSHFEAIYAIFFNTMSTRNAGFYTVNLKFFHPISQVLQSFMMWIGSSPASTAGGIRTTTLAIVIMSIIAMARGHEDVIIFKRKIPDKRVKMAFIVIFVGGFLMFFTAMVVLFENLVLQKNTDITFHESLYNTASAFGTTGLSLFDSAKLGIFSKISLIILMFVGQLGVSNTILAWSNRKRKITIKRIEEDIVIG